MNKLKKMIWWSVPLMISFVSCDWTIKKFCGEPAGELKEYIDSINVQHSDKLILSQIPCYPGYAQIDLKKNLSHEYIDSLEAEVKETHFTEVLIYDYEKNLIRGNVGSM